MAEAQKARVRTIDGITQIVRKNNIAGYCHSKVHPGVLTRKLLEEHDCLEKQCHYFEKNAESSYWAYLDQLRQRKEKSKQKRKREKEIQQAKIDALEEVRDLLQGYISDAGYTMEIVRVEQLRKNVYKIFYVSDNPFADGNRFPIFLKMVKKKSPTWRIHLQHIKGIGGHFVTCDEYHSIKKQQ